MGELRKTGVRLRAAGTALLAAAALTVLSASPAFGGADLAAAEAAVAAGDYGGALAILESAPAESARHHFLLGVALFEETRKVVLAERERGALDADRLEPPQAESYRKALGHFEEAVRLDPQSPDAPEAAFRAALLHDYGYLQRFGLTLDKYRDVMRVYPGTEAAEKARLRLEKQKGKFKMH